VNSKFSISVYLFWTMTEKYVMVSLEDEKSRKLGEAISNPNCKRIINLLAEKELSASEISKKLGIPLNSLDYNLKKLIDSGIIEKSKHFWSVKGKKIPIYRVVNKIIVIQPKKSSSSSVYSKLKGISLMLIVSAVLTALVAWLTRNNIVYSSVMQDSLKATESVPQAASLASPGVSVLSQVAPWLWFAIGALIIIIIFLILNWKKM
jgi:DNA-binding transcriptional ArsR family regulator